MQTTFEANPLAQTTHTFTNEEGVELESTMIAVKMTRGSTVRYMRLNANTLHHWHALRINDMVDSAFRMDT